VHPGPQGISDAQRTSGSVRVVDGRSKAFSESNCRRRRREYHASDGISIRGE